MPQDLSCTPDIACFYMRSGSQPIRQLIGACQIAVQMHAAPPPCRVAATLYSSACRLRVQPHHLAGSGTLFVQLTAQMQQALRAQQAQRQVPPPPPQQQQPQAAAAVTQPGLRNKNAKCRMQKKAQRRMSATRQMPGWHACLVPAQQRPAQHCSPATSPTTYHTACLSCTLRWACIHVLACLDAFQRQGPNPWTALLWLRSEVLCSKCLGASSSCPGYNASCTLTRRPPSLPWPFPSPGAPPAPPCPAGQRPGRCDVAAGGGAVGPACPESGGRGRAPRHCGHPRGALTT